MTLNVVKGTARASLISKSLWYNLGPQIWGDSRLNEKKAKTQEGSFFYLSLFRRSEWSETYIKYLQHISLLQ